MSIVSHSTLSSSRPATAEKRKYTEESYLGVVAGLASDAGNLLTRWWSGSERSDSSPEDKCERVTWAGFDRYQAYSTTRKCLIIGYETGFHVWDVENLDNVSEVVSYRCTGHSSSFCHVTCAKFLPTPTSDFHAIRVNGTIKTIKNLHGLESYPLLAVGYRSPDAEMHELAVYSVQQGKFVSKLPNIGREILSIECVEHRLMISVDTKPWSGSSAMDGRMSNRSSSPPSPGVTLLDAYDIHNEDFRHRWKYHWETPKRSTVVALGTRWMAFPSPTLPATRRSRSRSSSGGKGGGGSLASPGLAGAMPKSPTRMDSVSEIASAIGEMGATAISFMYSGPVDSESTSGSVSMYDVVDESRWKSPIAHFIAHSKPIRYLGFDPSGTLLASADEDGFHVNVFRVSPAMPRGRRDHHHQGPSRLGVDLPHHTYQLVRGMTSARIVHVAFSPDSRWVAVCSARGTVHVFAIRREGGSVSADSHAHPERFPVELDDQDCVVCHALTPLARIYSPGSIGSGTSTFSGLGEEDDQEHHVPDESRVAVVCEFHHGQEGELYILLVFPMGSMVMYQLRPRTSSKDASVLKLDAIPLYYWDTCRWTNWPTYDSNVSAVAGTPKTTVSTNTETLRHPSSPHRPPPPRSEGKWQSHVEITTHHTLGTKPLWAGPQFQIRGVDDPEHLGPHSKIDPSPFNTYTLSARDPPVVDGGSVVREASHEGGESKGKERLIETTDFERGCSLDRGGITDGFNGDYVDDDDEVVYDLNGADGDVVGSNGDYVDDDVELAPPSVDFIYPPSHGD